MSRSATWTMKNGRLEKVVPITEKFDEVIGMESNILATLREQLSGVPEDAYTRQLKKELVETCDEMAHMTEDGDLLYKVNYISKKLHSILGVIAGYSIVVKRAGFLLPLVIADLPMDTVYAVEEAVKKATGAADGAEKIRVAFEQLMGVATAIAEPILWFYALTAFIMMATGRSKAIGWTRLKNVGYAYVGITMLPAIFAFLRWLGGMLKVAFSSFGA